MSAICFRHCTPSCDHQHSCCRPLLSPIVVHRRHRQRCRCRRATTATTATIACPLVMPLSRPLIVLSLPSCCLIAPAGCCVASRHTALSSSSHRAALSSSCSGWLLHCLPSRHPLVLSSCLPLVLLLSYHCATLLLSHLTGWLLHCLSSYRLLVVLSLRHSLVVLLRPVVASTLVVPPSRPHVVPPPRPLIVLSLR